ncbi:Mitogen-activated protein kinase kinase kinase 5 [Linum grandiflorum]
MKDRHSLRSSTTFGFRSTSSDGPKLTRQRKLRYLSDTDVSSSDGISAAEPIKLSRSHSTCSSPPRTSSRPLPQPLRDNSNTGFVDLRLPSPREREKDKDRDCSREKSNGGGGFPLYTTPPSRLLVGRETRKTAEQPREKRSNRPAVAGLDLSSCRVFNPANSLSDSPEISPQRIRNASSTSPYYNMIPNGKQGWSAPEMCTIDIPGISPPAFFDCTTLSGDNSPLDRSPPSPVTARTSFEIPIARRDSNANVEVHKLPLPPGANLISPREITPAPQVTTSKHEFIPMKSQWQKGKLIGRGTFGSVFVATNRETGALCAMKEVDIFPDDPKSQECIKQLEQEIKILSKLKHPNIVQYYGSEIVEDHFYIYLEYVHPGSINKYVREHCGAVTESIVRSFTRHILSGLAYLHTMKTVHRDIKGANLLVDASGVVKLADFGMSKHLTGQVAELSLKGSPYWMAPELMQAVMQKDNNSDLALAVDIWSLGCTIIEMFTGKPPWSEFEGAAAMFKVIKDSPAVPETLSPEGKDFLIWCFKRNPAERPSACLLLEHRWLKQLSDALTPAPLGAKDEERICVLDRSV